MNQHHTTPGPVLDIPETVRQAAVRYQLGQAQDVRSERTTGSMVGIGAALFVVGLAGSLLISSYNSAQSATMYSGGTAHHFWAPTGAITLIGLGIAVRGLIIGTRKHYLYAGGLVHQRRSGVRAFPWSEVTSLTAVYGKDRGNVTGYRVDGRLGEHVVIPLAVGAGGRDGFVDRMLDLARRCDLPIR